MIAPDDYTYQFVSGREFATKGADFDKAVERWKKLPSDEGSTYDTRVDIDASARADLLSRYDELVPVLLDGHTEICHYHLDAEAVIRHLGVKGFGSAAKTLESARDRETP